MTPEQWSRLRTYEPAGSFDNPNPSPGPTPYESELAAKLKRWAWLMAGGVAFVVLVLLVIADRP